MRFLFLLTLLAAFACGKDGDNNTGNVKYFLERAASSTVNNVLLLEVDGEFKPAFSIKGQGFTAEVPAETPQAFQSRIALTAETFGEVGIELTLYQENGKPFLTDVIPWKSSGEVPPLPEPYFSERASADAYVYLIFPSKLLRGKNTSEVFVAGDVDPAEGSYFLIPSDDQVLIKLSEGDGLKTLRVKYRNIFGAHSDEVTLGIERKSVGPQNCKALPIATRTATGSIRTRIQADNLGPLFYKVTGDVALERDYLEFSDSIEEYIGLYGGVGTKRIVVKIKDEAGNFCPDLPLTIEYDKSYVPGSVTIEGKLLWTDDPLIKVIPKFDQLEGDAVEMFVMGTVVPGAQTHQWIPYSELATVELTPTSGTRHIVVQFRRGSTVLMEVTTSIFLRPYAILQGAGPAYQLLPGNILSATSLSISGCQEVYTDVPYQASFPCLAVDPAAVTVNYKLSDGTTLSRNATP